MFLHIGGDFSVRLADVISIYDYRGLVSENVGRKFLSRRKKETIDLSGGRPKSAVVTDDCIYLSALSPETLKKRSRDFYTLTNPSL